MGIKEWTCDEHWVLYGSAESLCGTPETNIAGMLTTVGLKTNDK